MAHVYRVQPQADDRGRTPVMFASIAQDFGQTAAPGTARAPDQAGGVNGVKSGRR
jgi:hypothetical protein